MDIWTKLCDQIEWDDYIVKVAILLKISLWIHMNTYANPIMIYVQIFELVRFKKLKTENNIKFELKFNENPRENFNEIAPFTSQIATFERTPHNKGGTDFWTVK